MKHVAMAFVRFYRRFLSGLKPTPTCRFRPTCSAYALEAFEKRGFFAGLILSVWRILRCSPLSPAGFDPVPEKGFKTMPLRWSKYDRYRAEQAANVSDDRYDRCDQCDGCGGGEADAGSETGSDGEA